MNAAPLSLRVFSARTLMTPALYPPDAHSQYNLPHDRGKKALTYQLVVCVHGHVGLASNVEVSLET